MKSMRKFILAVLIVLLLLILIYIPISSAQGPEITGFVTGMAGFCTNHQPIMSHTPDIVQIRASVPFEYYITITDPSWLSTTWTDNSTFFNITDLGPHQARIAFTIPDRDDDYWIGFHPVLITYDDGIGCMNSLINRTINFNITSMNRAPEIITYFPPNDTTITEEQQHYFNITFRDIDNENNFTYDDNNLSVFWYVDGDLVKNETHISPGNWSEYTFVPDYNSSGLRVIYVYVNDGDLSALKYWIVNVTDVYVDVDITQPLNGTSLLLFDNYTIFADIDVFENRSAINCNITLAIANTSVFDIRANESYSHFVNYIGGLSTSTQTWDIQTGNAGRSGINVTADCEQGGWTYDGAYTLSVNASETFTDLALPEGIYYNEPASLPTAGNYRYSFNITFLNLTSHSTKILGCLINQSNCYDDQLPGCKQIFVNKTTLYGIAFYNNSITYAIEDDDIINSTLGGTTDNWIPWKIDTCGLYESNMTPIKEVKPTWNIHVHPISWTTGDIANALNAKSAANQYMKNTIKSDPQGDVTFSVTKYGGTKVELVCTDGIDNPDESDTLADCADPECYGITYSCLPKQDFWNYSLYYSPSGSHGTLAAEIPPGDIASNASSAETFNTELQYTMHSMPNGTFKMRLRKWGISKTATFFIDGLPEIKSVDKYAPGDSADTGKMLYFLDNNGDPYYADNLPQSSSYANRIALRSYLSGGTEIHNLDTVINVSFADPSAIDMSEGHIIEITINYVEGSTPYEEKINITIYFDDATYDNGTPPRWNSANEHEDDITIAGTSWNACNDTRNGDFDYLNCLNNEQNCFDQSSYDCYDIDCDQKQGPAAWNDYTSMNTTGLCAYQNESQTAAMCFDGYNNDWSTEDLTWGHANQWLSLIDCRDLDCNSVSNGIWACEYNIELTCDDGYDNDMYNQKDCDLQTGGTVNDAEYDCAYFCQNDTSTYAETGTACDDNIDNDWDLYYRTDWSSSAGPYDYAYNNTFGAGMDCGWITDYPDEDCNMTYMGSGFRCEMHRELTCNDTFDNDYDDGHGQPDPGWTPEAYNSTFSTGFTESADYDDYDCQFANETPASEGLNANWCFDNIDNDLDAYYWNNGWIMNATTGRDCNDPDCMGVVNPANPNQSCLPYEYNASDLFFDYLAEPDFYCKNLFDDDADGPMDCYDSDCNKQFGMCFACPATENVTWDACADGIDNDYGVNTDCADTDCIGYLGDYDHHICAAAGGENTSFLCADGFDNDDDGKTDCADAGCEGIGSCSSEDCNDDIDNDGDGQIDCVDSDCSADCDAETDMSGTYAPPTKSSANYGNAQVTWDARVRNGTNYTINIFKQQDYDNANIYIGRLTGSALPIGTGLLANQFGVSGPNASSFEASQYNEDGTHTKGQIEIIDQVPGTTQQGFNVTIEIPTNSTLSSTSFEYYHSIDGIPSLGNMIDVIIVDSIKPEVKKVITEPTIKDSIPYGGSIWVGAQVTDEENGDYHDGTIDRCYYNVAGPNSYSVSGENADDCKFQFGNLIDDGIYTLTVWARDDTGNYADPVIKAYTIDIQPEYEDASFNISNRWHVGGENISISARFMTDDASSISYCTAWYKSSEGTEVFAGNMTASSSGDILACNGSITSPAADEMYEAWINMTDLEGDTAKSGSETFFVCNDAESSGVGTNGELWSCVFADMNEDTTLDVCEQKEIMITLKKHDTPDPVVVGENYLNYTITFMNRGYGTAKNITIIEDYSLNLSFINSTPMPDSGNNIWDIGTLGSFENGTIFIQAITNEKLMNGTIVTNIVNLTYYNSTNELSEISIEVNTTMWRKTPPVFIEDLPKDHEVTVGRTIDLGFDLDDYAYDPDLPYGDYLTYEAIIKNIGGEAEITITPGNRISVKGLKTGAIQVEFKVTDKWGEYDISSKILIVVKPAPRIGGAPCVEDWECTQWSRCGEDRLSYRTCTEMNNCYTDRDKPDEIRLCYEFEPSSCNDGRRNLGEYGIDCEGPCSLDCCENRYLDKNLGEEGIDCGGRCPGKCPVEERPAPFVFNEMLGVLVSIILLLIILMMPKAAYEIIKKEKQIKTALTILRKKEKKNPWMSAITKRYNQMIGSVKEPGKKEKERKF